MNIDLTPDELKLIISKFSPDDADDQRLLIKLTRYVFPDVEEDKLVEKYQEWKRNPKVRKAEGEAEVAHHPV